MFLALSSLHHPKQPRQHNMSTSYVPTYVLLPTHPQPTTAFGRRTPWRTTPSSFLVSLRVCMCVTTMHGGAIHHDMTLSFAKKNIQNTGSVPTCCSMGFWITRFCFDQPAAKRDIATSRARCLASSTRRLSACRMAPCYDSWFTVTHLSIRS